MSITGSMYRVSPSRFEELMTDPTLIETELYPQDFPANIEKYGQNVEKAWNAIEFTLDRFAEMKNIPWIGPLTGGRETGCVLHYGPVLYRTPEEVTDIADVLANISRQEFREGFMPTLMFEHNVYPDIWDEEDWGAVFDYVWQHFENMVRFYRDAADDGDAVLLHLA